MPHYNFNKYSSDEKLLFKQNKLVAQSVKKSGITSSSINKFEYQKQGEQFLYKENPNLCNQSLNQNFKRDDTQKQICDTSNSMYRVKYLEYHPTQKATNMPNLPQLFCFKTKEEEKPSSYQVNYTFQKSKNLKKIILPKNQRKPISHNFGSRYQLDFVQFEKESTKFLNEKQHQEHSSSFNFQDNRNFQNKNYFKNIMRTEASDNYKNASLQFINNNDLEQ